MNPNLSKDSDSATESTGATTLTEQRPATDEAPVAELTDVKMHYAGRSRAGRRAPVRAVDGISLTLRKGRTLGLVGESGSGKSTVARVLLRLVTPTAGTVVLNGLDITSLGGQQLRGVRSQMQMVFQDPYSSFDPLASMGDSLAEALRYTDLDRAARRTRVAELLNQVGLPPALAGRSPAEMSGGQLQRAAIARALAGHPSLIALDEPISSLDVSTQAQIVNLLRKLQAETGVAYLFISHDLSVVRHISHDLAVMYLGRLAEYGRAHTIYEHPRHPYTHALLSAVPVPNPTQQRTRTRIVLEGDIPSPARPPSGCRFRTRCPFAMDICTELEPAPFTTDDGTTVYCHLHTEGPKLDGAAITTLVDKVPPAQLDKASGPAGGSDGDGTA